jgi:hypothetical protein
LDPNRSEIYIRGSIGPGFAHELSQLLAQELTAHRIVITSKGGLIKQALEVALLVEKSDTDVVARDLQQRLYPGPPRGTQAIRRLGHEVWFSHSRRIAA